MTSEFEPLPSNLAAAHALILAERNARVMAEANAAVAKAEAANAQADLSSSEALIAHLKLEIEKLQREIYGTRSERKARLLEQMELQLEDLEAAATEDELAAENAAARTQTVQSFQRKRLSRKPFPDHLPRERVVIAAPDSCPCCGSAKLSKLGEDITETLEVIHAPPAALYYASRDRKHEHPVQHLQAFTGILQADAYSGYNELYDPSRSQGAITAALCWAHARRQFFELADIAANARRGKNAAAISPVALAAVKRIDAKAQPLKDPPSRTQHRRKGLYEP